jgi:undecaprenyl-diphosphatase
MDFEFPIIYFGILQGFTEVFPVSSSGHLAVARQLLNYQDLDLALAVVLHGGSLLAIAFCFRRDLASLWSDFWKSLPDIRNWARGNDNPFTLVGEQTVIYYMLVSLLPVMVIGWYLERIAAAVFEEPHWAATFLLINAALLTITAYGAHGERTLKELRMWEFILIGLLQGIAVLPGISRLGIVICTGLWLRLNWQEALKLAFILSIPVIAGSMLLKGNEIVLMLQTDPSFLDSLFIATCLAAVFSLIGLKFLTSRYLERRRLAFFGSYCLMVGLASLVYLYFWSFMSSR